MSKEDYSEKGYEIDDLKRDVERSSVVLEEEENSPIPEVAATVSIKDDPSLPAMTFRFWVMGFIFSVILSFFNQFFWFRTVPLTISPMVIQLVSYPIGKFMAAVLPKGILNPGPFNVKEHVLVSMTANCAASVAYAIDIVVIQRVFYDQDFQFAANIFLIFSTQMIGYGLAGVLRRYLVYPAAMIWPANLVQVALFNTLHKDEELQEGQMSRYKFFCIAATAIFFYQWIPGFMFTVLASIAWVCWINPKNHVLSQIGGSQALGIGALTLDWNMIVGYIGSPLVTPWWAQVNITIGLVCIAYILFPIMYYTNTWNAQRYPIISSSLYMTDGNKYNTKTLMKNGNLDEDVYKLNGPLRISSGFAVTYGMGFAGLASMVTHTWLHHRHKLVAQWKQSRGHSEDIHHKLMQAYPEVPDWWYGTIFVVMTAVAVATCSIWDYNLPWWGVLLAVAMAAFFSLPVGLIQALTNQQPGLNIITEYVIGYILPGRAVANVTFKTLGYISMAQGLMFTSDLKLGHYMKVPPRGMFWAQLLGTVIAGLTNLITANWMLATRPGICTEDGGDFKCSGATVFFSASVIWGAVAPARMFGPSSIYNPINYFFLVGFILPIPFYYLKKKYPESWVAHVHIPIILGATGSMPPARPFNYTNWLAVGFIFQYYARRYRPEWHFRYTYVLAAGLDSGLAVMLFVCFLVFQTRQKAMIPWWGTQDPNDLCPLQNKPLIQPDPPKV
ncbi:hypothetical protein CPB97_003656 [Podila verticillata]|nr:hypothetical protein CPB97_003656 [Podila verticillata]